MMRVSVSTSDIDLLTRHYKFCSGYRIPDDVTLKDVLDALRDCARDLDIARAEMNRESNISMGDVVDDYRDLLAKFKKEPD